MKLMIKSGQIAIRAALMRPVKTKKETPMAYRLRLAKAEQIPAIRILFLNAFKPVAKALEITLSVDDFSDLEGYLEARNLYVLMENEQLVGAFTLTEKNDCIYIDRLAVAPEWQHQGLGTHLLCEIELITESRELPFVRLHTPQVMGDLIRFYLEFGFSETHRALPSHGRDTILRVHFEKEIAQNSLHMDPELEHDRQLI